MRLAVPEPTNATAAALLWTYGTLPAFSHSTKLVAYRVPGGAMERLMWLAAGYRRPGDKFRAATDAGWLKPFPDPRGLYQELELMARAYDNEHPVDVEPVFASGMAAAIPAQMKAFLTLAWETLESARATGKEPMPPGVKLPGKKPIPRPTLPPPDVIPKPPLPLPRGPRVSGGLVLLLLAALAWGTRKGRR